MGRGDGVSLPPWGIRLFHLSCHGCGSLTCEDAHEMNDIEDVANPRKLDARRCTACAGHHPIRVFPAQSPDAAWSSSPVPSHSAIASPVCSPSIGAGRRTALPVRESLTGTPSVFMRPAAGCSTSCTMSRARQCGVRERLDVVHHRPRRNPGRFELLAPVGGGWSLIEPARGGLDGHVRCRPSRQRAVDAQGVLARNEPGTTPTPRGSGVGSPHERELRLVEKVAVAQSAVCLRERGRDLATTDPETDVVTDPPVGEGPAPRRL